MNGRLNFDRGTLNLDGGTLTLDGGTRFPYNLSTGVVQVLTGHCNLQRHKKTTGRAESFLCLKLVA